MTGIEKILLENRKIYAELMSIKEERKILQSHIDIEIALCGSKLYHHNELTREDIAPSSQLFCKLVFLYEKEQVLIHLFQENQKTVKEIRDNEKKSSSQTR